jgi:alkanesulfonate monooxygenase SsuD/methylene tetrahydromethanopterin reductase-like flavin-dependent oxidoreductase (luciferase family)
MEIGFHFVNFDVPGGVRALPTMLASAAQAAEHAGASWFTMADHFVESFVLPKPLAVIAGADSVAGASFPPTS